MYSVLAKRSVSDRFHFSHRVPRGLTLLDVVIVFCVMLLITALLLPFLQRARETSRRSQCRNNLKEIGLAIYNYQEVHNSYPAGFDVNPHGDYLGWGWHLKILPHMNSVEMYNKIEPHVATGIGGITDAPEFSQRLPNVVCPSDTASEKIPHAMVVTAKVVNGLVAEGTEVWNNRLPRSSYFGNAGYLQLEVGGIQYNAAGTPTSTVPLVNKGSLGNLGTKVAVESRYCDQKNFGGFFGQNSHVKISNVVDGTSNSIIIGERYSPADSTIDAVGNGTWLGVPDCTRAQGLAMTLGDASVRINIGMPFREQTTGYGSLHHDGAFFGLGDGAVRFISQDINLELYRSLSVIDDGSRSNYIHEPAD